MPPTKKKVDERYITHVARELQKLVDERFDGNQTRAAKALGMSQAHLSHLVAGQSGRGPGLNTLLRLREYTGRSIDALLGLPPVAEVELLERLRASLDTEAARLRRDVKLEREKAPLALPAAAESEPARKRRTKGRAS